MLGKFSEWLRQNRPEVVFLPVVIYGYIYVEGDSFQPCWNVLPFGLSSMVFLWLAVATAVLAAIFYTDIINNSPDQPMDNVSLDAAREHDEESGLYGTVMVVVFGLYLLFLTVSLGELLLRSCRSDSVLISILLFVIILGVVLVAEVLMLDSENF